MTKSKESPRLRDPKSIFCIKECSKRRRFASSRSLCRCSKTRLSSMASIKVKSSLKRPSFRSSPRKLLKKMRRKEKLNRIQQTQRHSHRQKIMKMKNKMKMKKKGKAQLLLYQSYKLMKIQALLRFAVIRRQVRNLSKNLQTKVISAKLVVWKTENLSQN